MTHGTVEQKVMDEAEEKTARKKGDRDFLHRLHQKHYATKKEVPNTEGMDPKEAIRAKLKAQRAKKVVKAKKAEGPDIASLDKLYQAKYKHYVPGSVHRTPGNTKLRARIRCVKDKKERDVFTSDLFQVTLCKPCLTAKRAGSRNGHTKPKKKGKK